MQRNTLVRGLTAFLAVTWLALPAHANMGIPMLGIMLPGMLVSLVPIIAVEAYILFERLGLSLWNSLGIASAANLGSTLIGIPVTWLLLLLVTLFTGGGGGYGIDTAKGKFLTATLGAPWLPPYEDRAMNWMVPAAGFVLLIPFFFASWLVEFQVNMLFLDGMHVRDVSNAVLIGNLITYGILGAIVATLSLHEFWITAKTVQPVYGTLDWIEANMSAKNGIGLLKSAEEKIARNKTTVDAQLDLPVVLIQGKAQETGETAVSEWLHPMEKRQTDVPAAHRELPSEVRQLQEQ